jgi:riboflavin biosynthesis pyrimidine reductase
MYEVMRYWETAPTGNGEPSAEQEYAKIWRAADKIVYSRSLESASSGGTRIEREFVPDAIRQLKDAATRDLSVSGPALAAQALRSGLVDECHLFLAPIVVGGGKQVLPDNVRVGLELLDERRFGNGVVHLHYRIKA